MQACPSRPYPSSPALIARVVRALVQAKRIDLLPHARLSTKVGQVILNCARHSPNGVSTEYLELTLQYKLFRDHAELQMSCGAQLLARDCGKEQLLDASKHYLLALSYFLHEKCYSLAMDCLRKLSLVLLQLE
jgi:spatacsin